MVKDGAFVGRKVELQDTECFKNYHIVDKPPAIICLPLSISEKVPGY